MFRTLTS